MRKTCFILILMVLFSALIVSCNRQASNSASDYNNMPHNGGMMGHQPGERITGQNENAGSTNVNPESVEYSGEVEDGVREINMTAQQFKFTPNVLKVKKGEKIQLNIRSLDVDHGLDIDGYEINEEIPAGQSKVMEFTADKSGQFLFHCSVYCGTGHTEMRGTLIVTEK